MTVDFTILPQIAVSTLSDSMPSPIGVLAFSESKIYREMKKNFRIKMML